VGLGFADDDLVGDGAQDGLELLDGQEAQVGVGVADVAGAGGAADGVVVGPLQVDGLLEDAVKDLQGVGHGLGSEAVGQELLAHRLHVAAVDFAQRHAPERGARVARRVLGPHPQRLQQRLLQRVLGAIEVLAAADQAREHPRDEGAQRAVVHPSRRLVDHARVSRPRAPRT